MPRKRHSPEQILGKLREVEVALAKGQTVGGAVRQIAVTTDCLTRAAGDGTCPTFAQAETPPLTCPPKAEPV